MDELLDNTRTEILECDDLVELGRLDNNLKTIDERLNFVENIVDENYRLDMQIRHTVMNGNRRAEEKPLNITIERMGTYLLRSSDIESCRKGDYSFFEAERDYRKMKVGKASISTDFASEEEFRDYSINDDDDDNDIDFKYDKYRLFNFNEMTPDQKKRLIKKGLKEKDNEYCTIREDLRSAYEYIMDMLTDEKDLDIVDMLISGMTEAEIADEMGVKRQGINKRIKNIVEKKI